MTDDTKPTGWDNGLCQDYCRELGRWFASRPGARRQATEAAAEIARERERMRMSETTDLGPLPEPRLWYDAETQRCSSMVQLRPTYEALWDESDMRAYAAAEVEKAVAAERERMLNLLRELVRDKPDASALTALAALTPSIAPATEDIQWAQAAIRSQP